MSHKQRWKTNEHNFLFLFILLRILFFPIPSFFYIFNSAFSDKAFLSNWNKSIIYLFKKFSENYIFLHWLCFQREKIQESWIFWCWEIKKRIYIMTNTWLHTVPIHFPVLQLNLWCMFQVFISPCESISLFFQKFSDSSYSNT